MSSISVDRFADEQRVREFYERVDSPLNAEPLAVVLGWLRADMKNVSANNLPQDGIRSIKRQEGIGQFDMVLIDGSEFTGSGELDDLYGATFVLLDDIRTFKNFDNCRRLDADPDYVLVEKNEELRNGYAVFERVTAEVEDVSRLSDPRETELLMRRSDRVWKQLAKEEPYSAIIAHETRTDFFASGNRHVQDVFRLIHRLEPEFAPRRALDFGCGVGRVLIPLALRCDEAVGVDISTEMLDEARRNCAERGCTNVEFATELDQLANEPKFDLVHSFIVLQHLSPTRGQAIISALVDLLDDDGIGVIQVPYVRDALFLSGGSRPTGFAVTSPSSTRSGTYRGVACAVPACRD